MSELVALPLPADIAAAVAELRHTKAGDDALDSVMLRGAELLEAERHGAAGLRHRLRMANGDELFHRSRLLTAQHEVKQLCDEVWALEERVLGERPDQPPAQLPERLPAVCAVLVRPCAAAVAAAGDDADDLGLLALVCYGLGAQRAEAVAEERLGVEANGAMGSFAARKHELRTMLTVKEHLERRRAGLRGMLQSARLAARATRRPGEQKPQGGA